MISFSYFLHFESDKPWKEEEALAYDARAGRFLMAFNGWVMNHDPLKNFAESDSQVPPF